MNNYYNENWARCFNRFKEDFYKGYIQDVTFNWFRLQSSKYKEGTLKKERKDLMDSVYPNVLTLGFGELKREALIQRYGRLRQANGYNIHLLVNTQKLHTSEVKEVLYKYLSSDIYTIKDYCIYCYKLYKESVSKYNNELKKKGITEYELLQKLVGGSCPSELQLNLYTRINHSGFRHCNTIYYAELYNLYLKNDSSFICFLQSGGYAIENYLTERERGCLDLYYNKHCSLAEISNVYNVHIERVRQIIAKGERKVIVYNRGKTLPKTCQKPTISKDLNKDDIDNLMLSRRCIAILKSVKVTKVSQLESMIKDRSILKVRNLGRKSIEEIEEKLKEYKESILCL